MEKHYTKNMGEITYVYGVNLEEHKKVIENQQKRIAELEQELAKYKELQDRLGLKNADEFEWFVMLDLLTDNEKNMHILDLQRELAELKEKAIVPPVKIGDTIYVVPSETNYRLNIVNGREEQNKVYGWIVSEIRYNKHGYSIVCDVGDAQFYCNYEPPKNLCGHFDTEKYYGETWFSTLEEAEKKLQELRGGDFSGE